MPRHLAEAGVQRVNIYELNINANVTSEHTVVPYPPPSSSPPIKSPPVSQPAASCTVSGLLDGFDMEIDCEADLHAMNR